MPKSYKYSPIVIRVKAGTTVTWQNDGNFTHSVFVPACGVAPNIDQHVGLVQIAFD